jgi:hypothetical protein
MSDVARILLAIDRGEKQAAEKLLPLVCQQFCKLAAAELPKENPGQSMPSRYAWSADLVIRRRRRGCFRRVGVVIILPSIEKNLQDINKCNRLRD